MRFANAHNEPSTASGMTTLHRRPVAGPACCPVCGLRGASRYAVMPRIGNAATPRAAATTAKMLGGVIPAERARPVNALVTTTAPEKAACAAPTSGRPLIDSYATAALFRTTSKAPDTAPSATSAAPSVSAEAAAPAAKPHIANVMTTAVRTQRLNRSTNRPVSRIEASAPTPMSSSDPPKVASLTRACA